MIRIATGVTPNYLPRARAFLRSLEPLSSRSNAMGAVFIVADDPPSGVVLPIGDVITVKYADAALQLPKWMLQNGGFCDFVPEWWAEDDVIIFCDADAVLQRAFTEGEKALFNGLADFQVLAGRNKPCGTQRLDDEATALSMHCSHAELEEWFPDYDKAVCLNFGFVAARLSTWRLLLKMSVKLWPNIERAFANPAMVQWMMCYAIHALKMTLLELPLSVHAHGHLGLPEGVTCTDGVWYHNGAVVAYAHAL